MRFSESWKIAASVSLRTSSAASRLIARPRNRGIRSRDHSPQQRLVAHDLDVVLDARTIGNALHQARHVSDITDRLQILVPIQLLDQRDHVDRPRRLRQIHHPRVNAPVRIKREILDPQMLGCLVVRKVVEQNRAQDRAFSFYIRGERADRVLRSGQRFFPVENFAVAS